MQNSHVRLIAFHLPQFHPIPENDEWWGKGFTEWTNVTKARPRFPGHYQPHLPADLGFYDLRLAEAREAQAALAREYGIYGFCYYHYWFNARRLLERPVNEILARGEPAFPFCLCWANENWTRRWDGQEQEILRAQIYGAEDDLDHIRWLIPVFRDERYIRIQGRPLFLVYRLSLLPSPGKTVELWRNEARRQGLGDIFICNVESSKTEHGLTAQYGLDGAVEFAPDFNSLPSQQAPNWLSRMLCRRPRILNFVRRFGLAQPWLLEHRVYSYDKVKDKMLAKSNPPYLRFPCVTPGWDNSARRNHGATILSGSTPTSYREWLATVVERSKTSQSDDLIVFINAWNEWAEGNHLEPCQKWGRAYLEATRSVLNRAAGQQHNPSKPVGPAAGGL